MRVRFAFRVSRGDGAAPRIAATLTALRLRNALSWLEEHTEDEDRKLARHLAQREAPACTPPPGA